MNAAALQTILRNHQDIELAIVFGSCARGRARTDSDLDIAIKARAPLDATHKMRIIEELAAASGRPIDLIDLDTAGEPILGEILRHGQRVHGDHSGMAELMQRHVYATEDFVPQLERMLQERRAAWIG